MDRLSRKGKKTIILLAVLVTLLFQLSTRRLPLPQCDCPPTGNASKLLVDPREAQSNTNANMTAGEAIRIALSSHGYDGNNENSGTGIGDIAGVDEKDDEDNSKNDDKSSTAVSGFFTTSLSDKVTALGRSVNATASYEFVSIYGNSESIDRTAAVSDDFGMSLGQFDAHLVKRDFVNSENDNVFIFGAVVRNSSNALVWDVCNIYGEWHSENTDGAEDFDHVTCCLKYDGTDDVRPAPVSFIGKTWHNNKKDLKIQPWYMTCALPNTDQILKGVSIARGTHKCDEGETNFIEPVYVMKENPGYLVISTKTAHEKLDPDMLIAQFETLRYLGVDKIITYVENTLWDEAKKVLGYYASQGLVSLYTYDLADVENNPRTISQQDHQIFADQTTIMRDAVERNSGATYFGILDNDEFPIPSGNRTLKETLETLGNDNPDAAFFMFKNQHYFTDVRDSTCQEQCMFFSRYLYTPPGHLNKIHKKFISYPSRIWTGTMYSHQARPLSGYKAVECSEEEIYIRHYGACERKFKNAICFSRDKWLYNTSMVAWAEGAVANRIRAVTKMLRFVDP